MPLVTCIMQGGIGNQLFQIFTTMEYSFNHNIPFYLPNFQGMVGCDSISPRPSYWNTFFKNLQPHIRDERLMNITINYNEKDCYIYSAIPYFANHNIRLIGYFQNVKYFSEYGDKIIEKIGIRGFQKEIKDKYDITNTISLHFRIGDYNSSNLHLITGIQYYINALQKIISLTYKDNYIIKYRHEERDTTLANSHINRLKKNFPNMTFERVDNTLNDWQQMLYMSLCDHNVIANSTFSWWSAYLNENKDKIVCMPDKWLSNNDNIPEIDCNYNIIKDNTIKDNTNNNN